MRRDLIEWLRCPWSGARLRLEALDEHRDHVEAGLLHGPCGTFPIVAGIPVLRGGDDAVVDSLRGGEVEVATALAVMRDVPLGRLDALLPVLEDMRPTQRAAAAVRRQRDRHACEHGRRALRASASTPDPLLRLTHLDNRRPNPEGYRYFRYRLGLPRHLVALAAVSACRPGPEPVVEIGCGAGHLTWQVERLLAPRRVIGIDRRLDLLWVARRHVAPTADLVCADAVALPIATSSCSLAVAVDVLSFVEGKASAVRELWRVLRPDGGIAATSLINADTGHEFAGIPLPATAWRELLLADEQVVFADATALDHYLGGSTAPAVDDPRDVLAAAQTITVMAGRAAVGGLGCRFDAWPHAVGTLGLHPLLAPTDRSGGDVVLERLHPSPGFDRDNRALDHYLPRETTVPAAALAALEQRAAVPGIDELLRSVIVLGFPDALAKGLPGTNPLPAPATVDRR